VILWCSGKIIEVTLLLKKKKKIVDDTREKKLLLLKKKIVESDKKYCVYIHSHVARFFVLHLFMYKKILLVIQQHFLVHL